MRFRSRVFLIVTAAAVAAAGSSAAVLAASGPSAPVLQAVRYTSTPAVTSSPAWVNVPGLSGMNICAAGPVTVIVSVELDGARPAGLRVMIDGGPVAQPGAVRAVPAGPHDSASFTFAQSVSAFEASDRHVLDVQWRSPAGGAVHLERGSAVLLYAQGTAC